jgi:3-oxoacyl-[acyl-carrier protein] reductase
MRLAGKVALVTGASSGIGAAVAAELAREGASVTVNYFRNAAGAEAVVRDIEGVDQVGLAIRADIRQLPEVSRMFDEHLQRFGRLDILVNNAGDMIKRMPTAETPEEIWRDAIDLNLSSAFFCCQKAIAPMTEQGWGRIVNVSSVGARTGGGAGSIPYHAAKGGMMTLTKGLAREVAASGITVNTVAAGIIDTGFHDRHTASAARAEWVRTLIPMQRSGQPIEVAKAVVFLASNDAAYITGATLDVNGGMAMY